jgi:dTMP kinase
MLAGLAQRLREAGRDVVTTHEPGGTALADAIRQLVLESDHPIAPVTEALLMSTARAQVVSDVIRPALNAGKCVLCDRYAMSTLAYQGFGHGVPFEALRSLTTIATGGLEPDVVLLVDIPVGVSRARVAARATERGKPPDRLEREDEAFHARVREGYLALARGDRRVHVLDGLRPTIELIDLAQRIVTAQPS